MEPAFGEFDRVLTYNWSMFKRGSVIVFKWKGTVLIKRIDKIEKGKIYVSGDNKKMSSKIEPISFDKVIGRVFLKY